jgi:hypothetical protein
MRIVRDTGKSRNYMPLFSVWVPWWLPQLSVLFSSWLLTVFYLICSVQRLPVLPEKVVSLIPPQILAVIVTGPHSCFKQDFHSSQIDSLLYSPHFIQLFRAYLMFLTPLLPSFIPSIFLFNFVHRLEIIYENLKFSLSTLIFLSSFWISPLQRYVCFPLLLNSGISQGWILYSLLLICSSEILYFIWAIISAGMTFITSSCDYLYQFHLHP